MYWLIIQLFNLSRQKYTINGLFYNKKISFYHWFKMQEMSEVYVKEYRNRAIYISNCVQIWKGRDRKTVLCRVRHKKSRAKGETFFMSKPVKICFPISTFLYENKILRTHNFFCRNDTFLKAREFWKTPVYCTRLVSGNVQITGLVQ